MSSDREQLADLVNFDKGNVSKLERRLQDTKDEIQAIQVEKKKEDENIKSMQAQLDERKEQIEKLQKQNLYLNNLIIHFQRENGPKEMPKPTGNQVVAGKSPGLLVAPAKRAPAKPQAASMRPT